MPNSNRDLLEPSLEAIEKLVNEYDEKYDDDEDAFLSGYMHFDDLIIPDFYMVIIVREDWKKPHIHLENESFHCAIRLDRPEYFIHDIYTDKLNNKQAKLFDEYMDSIDDLGHTVWQYAMATVKLRLKRHKIKVTKQPDYTKLND